MDKFGFKAINVIISFIELGVCSTIYFFSDNALIFVIENLLVAFCLSGTFTTITPLFNFVFGKDLATEIYGLTGFSIGIASFIGPLLTKIMIKKDEDYLVVYSIGGGICLMKFIALICFKPNEPYIFKNKRDLKDNQKTNKIENENENINDNENNQLIEENQEGTN